MDLTSVAGLRLRTWIYILVVLTLLWPGDLSDVSILGEWPRLLFTARIGRAPSELARSASKKGTWPLTFPSSAKAIVRSKRLISEWRSRDPEALLRIAGRTLALPYIALSAIYEQWETLA
jgi:hypothetical protein